MVIREIQSEEWWKIRSRRSAEGVLMFLWTRTSEETRWTPRGRVVGEVARGYPRSSVLTREGLFSLPAAREEFE